MKKILLVRHAKSSWDNFNIKDHDRPLNERGIRDAPLMAALLYEKEWIPQGIYSSTALRAKETALAFAEKMGVHQESFHLLSKLYHAPTEVILDVIQEADDRFDCIAIFCHNPGVTSFAYDVLQYLVPEIATCGVLTMTSEVDQWSEVKSENIVFKDYYYPKML